MTRFALLLLLISPLCWGETYSFSGDSSFSVIRKGEEVTTIEGNVKILSETKEILADSISIIGVEDPEFSGSGDVEVWDIKKSIRLKSQEFSYSSAQERLRSNGDVRLEDEENELFIRCQVLTVLEEKDQIVMEIGVRLFKEDIICRSQYALYNRESNFLELTGFPVVYKGDDVYKADQIQVNLDTDEITMIGSIEGSLISETEGPKEEVPQGEEPPQEIQSSEEKPLQDIIGEPKGEGEDG